MTNKLEVVAAVLDKQNLLLYKTDGNVHIIPQGDQRIKGILDLCRANLKKLGDVVTVDISEVNHYADFEEKTGGLVKLFRVAKSKVKGFFKKTEGETLAEVTLGVVPTAKDVPLMTATVTRKVHALDSAIEDIMTHAVPVASKEFSEPANKEHEEDTVIAVVGNQVIPDVAALKPQMAATVLRPNASTIGMERFLERLAKVMGKRRHSVEDLMKFMAKGDLPIADDGSIVIYKILKRKGGSSDTFVDCHTKNVPQKVGSYVHMDEELVDPDRRQDCSNGLHVARRGYLHGFAGDVVVLAKVAPEDVIAVPQYDSNKMRVCGYHILALLSAESFKKLRDNKPMTDNSADQLLLGKVLAGDHIGVLERVKIGGHKGTNISITPVGKGAPEKPAAPVAQAVPTEALPENGHVAPAIDVKEVAKAVLDEKESNKANCDAGLHSWISDASFTSGNCAHCNEPFGLPEAVKEQLITAPPGGMHVCHVDESCGQATPPPAPAEAKPVKKLSLAQTAMAMYGEVLAAADLATKQSLAAGLVLFKKEKKKSWESLGFASDTVASIEKIAAPALPQKGAIFTNDETIAKAVKKSVPKVKKPSGELTLKAPKPPKADSPKDQIAKLLSQPPTTTLADEIVAIKKKAKKGWDVLGVKPVEVSIILSFASK